MKQTTPISRMHTTTRGSTVPSTLPVLTYVLTDATDNDNCNNQTVNTKDTGHDDGDCEEKEQVLRPRTGLSIWQTTPNEPRESCNISSGSS